MNLTSHNPNPSRFGHSNDSSAVSIDVAQWRQDVDAFATATRQMLDSIHEELSNGLAAGEAAIEMVDIDPPMPRAAKTSVFTKDLDARPTSDNNFREVTENECDQLLDQLKKRLSEQLSE